MAFYKCDPDKNIKCEKKTCYRNGGTCAMTSNVNYSTDGKIITGSGIKANERRIAENISNY